MQPQLQNPMVLAGRILLGLIFVLSGIGKIAGFDGTVAFIASKNLPLPAVVAALTIAVELGGGIALALGIYTRQAALLLAVFTLAAGFIFHNFWDASGADRMAQQINFLKNLAIAGGMLVVAAFGPGKLSIDARPERSSGVDLTRPARGAGR